jgi:hypothetical protein
VFDGPVSAFGSAVGEPGFEVCEELGFPFRNRRGYFDKFTYGVVSNVLVETDQKSLRLGPVDSGVVDLGELLRAVPDPFQFAVNVAGTPVSAHIA